MWDIEGARPDACVADAVARAYADPARASLDLFQT
jgi:hypothetical protein